MASNQIEKIVNIYKALARNPSLAGAKIIELGDNITTILSFWSQRNLERKINQKFSQTHILNSEFQVLSENFPVDTTTELLSATTEDNQRKAVLRQATSDNTTKQFIEIWDRQRLVKNYDLAALDVHGDVYTDSEFASFEWSPDKTKLLYVAEKKLPKSEPFYKQKPIGKKDKDKKEEDEVTVGNEYIYKPHWGEQLVGKHRPVVAVLDTITDTISALPGIPDELSPAQVLWTEDSESIIGVAWKHEPRYLGLIACTNRLSWIFLLKNGEYKKISSEGCAVRRPRLSPDRKKLIWLEREAGGPHHNAHRLMYIENFNSENFKADVLVDIVPSSIISIKNSDKFYGLYNMLLPRRCWSTDSQYIFLSTPQQYNIRSYIIDTRTKTTTEIQNDNSSLSILDVKNDIIAFAETSLLKPPVLTLGRWNSETVNNGNIKRTILNIADDASQEISTVFQDSENFMCEPSEYDYDNDEEIRHFNFIYLGPKSGNEKSVPLVVAIHGGPHMNYANSFILDHYLFVKIGFAVLQVNYRGSSGMGSKNLEYLQGRVGNVDVKDCMIATKEALKKYPWLNPDKIGLSGGSHGGFLVAHLSGQYPDLYKVVVARNPVIDIAAMFTISDIPDWCCAAIGQTFDESKQLSESEQVEMLVKMYKCSPIVHVGKVKAPTLMCLGSNDLRVPSSQGKMWYQRLKANNVKTKMLLYEDNHPLASGPVEIDNVINACLWLQEHISTEKNE